MSWTDLNPLLAAFLLHLFAGYGVLRLGRIQIAKGPQVVQVEVRRAPPPPLRQEPPPTPLPELPPPPPKAKPQKVPARPTAPMPNETPKQAPPAEPPKPIFGLSASSTTTGDSSFAVPVGNTTVTDPKNLGKPGEKPAPLPSGPVGLPPGPPAFKPVSPLEIKSEPEVDDESCSFRYPDGEAKQLGVEGDSIFRVEIDERGKVHAVKIVKGIGYGLDETAIDALKHRCKITPARNSAGQPVAFVIRYTYHWVLER